MFHNHIYGLVSYSHAYCGPMLPHQLLQLVWHGTNTQNRYENDLEINADN